MNKEQIIDEAYENYITQTRIEFEKWRERNPDTLVDYREDTKELFLKSIKEDTHWFTGEKKFSEKWGLKIEERELSLEERGEWDSKKDNVRNTWGQTIQTFTPNEVRAWLNEKNVPTKLITITYKDTIIESYENLYN